MPFDPFSGIGADLLANQAANATNEVANNKLNGLFSDTQVQMAYMWEVELGGDTGDAVSVYARATAIPTTLIEQTKRYYCGVEYSYAGRDTSPRVFRVTFFDTQDFVVRNFIENWKNQLANGEDNKMLTPNNYFRNIKLMMKDVSDDIITQQYQFIDCYPTEISETSLTYESSEVVTFDVMFAYRRKI